jgi:lipid II:glycine glycyltransferase (peptidoglycan interpeptide bridge formation enzyme)
VIRLATELEIARWDELICSNFDGGHLYQSQAWASIKQAGGWQPVYCIYEATAYFVAFLLIKKPASILGNIYYCSKGPGFFKNYQASKLAEAHFMEFSADLVSFLRKLDKQAILVKIEPELEFDTSLDLGRLGYIKYRLDLQSKATIMQDISDSLDGIMTNFKSKTRYNIRLAVRKGVKVERRPMDDSAVDLMYDLMQTTQKRGGYFLRPKQHFANYWRELSAAGLGQLLVATHQSEVLGAVFVARFSGRAYYKDGGSYDSKRNLMAPYLLQWEAIKWAKQNGDKLYDMVGVPPIAKLSDSKHPQSGLYQFKRSFSDNVVEFVGCWDMPINSTKYKLWANQEEYFLRLYARIRKNLFW